MRSLDLEDDELLESDLMADGRVDATGEAVGDVPVGEGGGDHFALAAWKDGTPTSIDVGFELRDIFCEAWKSVGVRSLEVVRLQNISLRKFDERWISTYR